MLLTRVWYVAPNALGTLCPFSGTLCPANGYNMPMREMRACWICEQEDCGHSWIALSSTPPEKCAKCRSRRWNGLKSENKASSVPVAASLASQAPSPMSDFKERVVERDEYSQ